jgi:hypothetical protein
VTGRKNQIGRKTGGQREEQANRQTDRQSGSLIVSPFYLSRVNGIIHNCSPSFESCNLEKSEVGATYVVKVDPGVGPVEVVVQARVHVVDDRRVHDVAVQVDALDVAGVKVCLVMCLLFKIRAQSPRSSYWIFML